MGGGDTYVGLPVASDADDKAVLAALIKGFQVRTDKLSGILRERVLGAKHADCTRRVRVRVRLGLGKLRESSTPSTPTVGLGLELD